MLEGKKILIGVTGSIAAYKTAILVRLLKKSEAEVRVVMTPSASQFIGPVTLATLSKNKVETDFTTDFGNDWTNHVELGLWADLMVVAPATASTISKFTSGQCDNLLVATYLSAKCPVWIAPAMDLDMFKHPSTANNLSKLKSFGHTIIEPTDGELASGLSGKGRMEEPEIIVDQIIKYFEQSNILNGIKALVTAGPTYEHIDPVRFIGNPSSGKMGYSIAEVLASFGANVELIAGSNGLEISHPNINVQKVKSAEEMYEAVHKVKEVDIFVMSAAVADYTPVEVATEKMKKGSDRLTIELKRTKDILLSIGQNKKNNQTVVGFAMETQNELENAQLKLQKKNADMIVLNSLKNPNAGFGVDTNQVTLVTKEGVESLEVLSKKEVAHLVVKKIIQLRNV